MSSSRLGESGSETDQLFESGESLNFNLPEPFSSLAKGYELAAQLCESRALITMSPRNVDLGNVAIASVFARSLKRHSPSAAEEYD